MEKRKGEKAAQNLWQRRVRFFLPIWVPVECREIPCQNNGSAHRYLLLLLFYLLSAKTSFIKKTCQPIVTWYFLSTVKNRFAPLPLFLLDNSTSLVRVSPSQTLTYHCSQDSSERFLFFQGRIQEGIHLLRNLDFLTLLSGIKSGR